MLALGTSESLRKKHGDRYHVHLIMKTAPYTSDSDMDRVKSWISENLAGADIEDRTFHGQLRFSIPANHAPPPLEAEDQDPKLALESSRSSADTIQVLEDKDANRSGIGALITLLESQKEALDFEYYSVSQTTLDQVFLSIVGKHNIEEENNQVVKKSSAWQKALKATRLA